MYRYFFTNPDFDSKIAQKFRNKVLNDPQKALQTLNDLYKEFNNIEESEWNKDNVNKLWSQYLYDQNQNGNFLKNQDVFFLLRYAVTGNYVGAPIGDVCYIVGKIQTLDRMQDLIFELNNEIGQLTV